MASRNSSLGLEYDKIRDASTSFERQIARWEYPKPIIGAVSGWCFGAASGSPLPATSPTLPTTRCSANRSAMRRTDSSGVLLAGFKNALRYALTGDHIDAQSAAHRLVNEVVPKDQLIDTCFNTSNASPWCRRAVKINLHIANVGLEMMGLRSLAVNAELSAMARLSKEKSSTNPWKSQNKGGLKLFRNPRRAVQTEPFGPRKKGIRQGDWKEAPRLHLHPSQRKKIEVRCQSGSMRTPATTRQRQP
jgi:enoyl-CoA hydratase